MGKLKKLMLLSAVVLLFLPDIVAQNPIIRNQFTADPTARVFNGKIYLFPSHDIPAPADFARKDWFCMEDYHVFSSENLTDWTDHGVIVTQTKVPWISRIGYDMWAPDCVFRNGKYYFYFPVNGKIGVATADKPEGPYTVLEKPVVGMSGIDPCVIIDKDGQAYIYTSQGRFIVAKLKENMVELDGKPQTLPGFPTKGLIEGPFVFERNGIYYMTYPHVNDKIVERLEYATSSSPMGPFTFGGVLMDESPTGCWTNHHSLVQYNNQWYLFYHHNDYSPKFDKNRAARVDSLSFNADGSINKVIPTLRGVGVSSALKNIEVDRYSAISDKGASIALIDTVDTFKGWKTLLQTKGSWIKYNTVDFGSTKFKTVQVQAAASKSGVVEIRLESPQGLLLAEVKIPAGSGMAVTNAKVKKFQKGINNLVIVQKGDNPVEIDWVKFAN
ncbi:MAG TPA: family 43 glycosylhydrolase [Bacteroidales bacterium]|nr:family 43 glycosylhydrolase [Bacteroidales bacterium]